MRARPLTVLVLMATSVAAQTLSNVSLTGKYFVRHVEFTTDANNNVTDARSINATIIFAPGPGTYTLTGQQVIGTTVAAPFTASGSYSVNSAGIVTLTNPQKTSANINARFGAEAVIGSSTEIGANTFDMFVAIPAPTGTPTNASVAGAWNATDFELTAATTAQVRNSFIQFSLDGAGNLTTATVKGHAVNYSSGATVNQSLTAGAYAVNTDGTGTFTFPAPTGIIGAGVVVGSAQRALMLSATGHVLLLGTPGAHDIAIAVQSPASPVTVTRDWFAEIRVDSTGYSNNYVSATTAIAADASFISAARLHETQSATPINVSEAAIFTLVASDGTGSTGPSKIAAGAGGIVSTNVGGVLDPTGYSIAFGVAIPSTTSGGGVYINPQGVVNAASNAPVGNPISPGEFIAIYGSSLANQTVVATPPYPTQLGGVTVSIGGLPAPIYLVSSGQINCLVPYGVSTAQSNVTIAVMNNSVSSNIVSVPISATAPGIFSNDTSGTGDGTIVHLSGALVTPSSPATKGETLSIYLTGLGNLVNPIKDGNAPNPPAADNVTTQVVVYVNGIAVPNLQYAGINPTYPGLYQINFTVPTALTVSGELPVAIQTADSFHDQINLSVR